MPRIFNARLLMAVMYIAMLGGGLSAAGVLADVGIPQVTSTSGDTTTTEATTSGTTTTPETTVPDATDAQQAAAHRRQVAYLRRDIKYLRGRTHYWQYLSMRPLTRGARLEMKSNDVEYLRWRVRQWTLRRDKARTYAMHPPHEAAWRCIHGYEASWTDSGIGDPIGAVFWGGLQFGPSEWRRFGGQFAPTANLATPLEQMWAAERYYYTPNGHGGITGFGPWPRTARKCGLLR